MIVINNWVGRTGNNILQLIRAIYYAIKMDESYIIFPTNEILNSQQLIINDTKNDKDHIITDSFFYLNKFQMTDPEPYEMKNIFSKFIKPIFNINILNNVNIINFNKPKEIYIHIRGGDIFQSNPHSAYVQPPLFYYKKIIENFEKIFLIAEDNSNPCVDELLKLPNVSLIKNSLEKEI